MRKLMYAIALALLLQPVASSAAERPVTFELTNQDGKRVTEHDFAGRYMLVFFGYTHCPEICPTTLGELSVLSDEMPAEMASKLSLVFITGDPQRDTPAVLHDYLSSFDNGIIGLSGPVKSIDDLAWTMKAVIVRHGNGTGNYSVDHSTNYILLHDGKILDQIPNTLSTDDLIARIHHNMAGQG
jgi:protein SCO1